MPLGFQNRFIENERNTERDCNVRKESGSVTTDSFSSQNGIYKYTRWRGDIVTGIVRDNITDSIRYIVTDNVRDIVTDSVREIFRDIITENVRDIVTDSVRDSVTEIASHR